MRNTSTSGSAGAPPTFLGRIAQLLGRSVVILLVAALVTAATILLASGPFGSTATNTGGSAISREGGAPRPQLATGTDGSSSQAAVSGRPAGAERREGGGRNTPSLTRGLPTALAYAAIMAIATLTVVLVLRGRTVLRRRAMQA